MYKHKYNVSFLVVLAICSHTIIALNVLRTVDVQSDITNKGVSYSKIQSVSKSRARLEESMKDTETKAEEAGKKAAKNTETASRSAAASATADVPNPDDLLGLNKPCIERKEKIDAVKFGAVLTGAPAYGVFSTNENYNEIALLLRGTPLNGTEEINQLCLHGTCTPEEHTITGFTTSATPNGYTSVSNCEMDKSTYLDVTCKPNSEKSSPPIDNKSAITVSKGSIIWTDYEQYVVAGLCFSDGKKAWVTIGKGKDIDEKTQATVLEKVKDVGLDVTDPRKLNYDQCKA